MEWVLDEFTHKLRIRKVYGYCGGARFFDEENFCLHFYSVFCYSNNPFGLVDRQTSLRLIRYCFEIGRGKCSSLEMEVVLNCRCT